MSYFALPPLGVNPSMVTVGGYSSGGAEAFHVHVILSSKIKGASLNNSGLGVGAAKWMEKSIAEMGIEFKKNLNLSSRQKTTFLNKFLPYYIGEMKENESKGLIDNLSNLKNAPVYISGGSKDTVVAPMFLEASYKFYKDSQISANP